MIVSDNFSLVLVVYMSRLSDKTRAPSEDRTHDPWFTRPVLYPLSYGGTRLNSRINLDFNTCHSIYPFLFSREEIWSVKVELAFFCGMSGLEKSMSYHIFQNIISQTGNRTPAAAVRAPNPNH